MASGEDGRERFDEARLRQVFRRAIEIDELAANTLDIRELHEIAAAVGIRPESLNQALDELRRAEKARRKALKYLRRVRRIMTAAAGLVLGLLASLMTMLFGPGAGGNVMSTTIVLLAAVVLLLLVYNRSRGNQRVFQIENAVIWAAFLAGSIPASRIVGGFPPGVLAWLVLALLGLVLIGDRRAEPPGLSRDVVVDRTLGSVRDQARRDAAAERRRVEAVRESPGGTAGPPLPATS